VTDCVLDASVAVKWFLPPAAETLVAEARQLLKDYRDRTLHIVVPDLFWLEAGNVLWKAARRGLFSLSSAEEALRTLDEWDFPTLPSRPLLDEAFAIAAAFDRTVYDSVYVALAVASRFPLITADERLANALAAHAPVRWLGSL
jgi:predicted nucleic acid-binding protein